jgi:signal transduction histidine kinase
MAFRYAARRITTLPALSRERTMSLMLAGWLATAALAVMMVLVSTPFIYQQSLTICAADTCVPGQLSAEGFLTLRNYGISLDSYAIYWTSINVVSAFVWFAIGSVIFWRRPDEWMPMLVSWTLILAGTLGPTNVLAHSQSFWSQPALALNSLAFVGLIIVFYLFPDGRFVPRWMCWIAVAVILLEVAYAFFPTSVINPDSWSETLGTVVYLGILISPVAAQIYRYRRDSNEIQRQQTKWAVAGLAMALLGIMVVIGIGHALGASMASGSLLYIAFPSFAIVWLLVIPLSLAVAVLRYRLYDIDLIINRALVYLALTGCVIGIYVIVVGWLGAVLQARGNVVISLVAAGIIAVLFQPLRERLQRGVNRLMYGDRDDPYDVVSRLGQRLEATLAPDTVLKVIVETVKDALKLPYAAIALRQEGTMVPAASAGTSVTGVLRLPLIYRGNIVGELVLGPRSGEDTFSPADRSLLDDLARQAGVAVHGVGLTIELQRARERLVTTREEERRRIRRNLHDGLGPRLASQSLTLAAACKLLVRDPDAALDLLQQLRTQTREAVADIRRLVYDLRPPTLDDLGLIAALNDLVDECRSSGIDMHVTAPDRLLPMPAAVEVAAYRIVQEALTNVVRHAHASTCAVSLDIEDTVLSVTIHDDGVGLPADRRAGIGLPSMRERAAELGGSCSIQSVAAGGTIVTARLPLPPEDAWTNVASVS